ncbi:6-carboxytetrahydropterin synthase QueD [Candidatus Peregrinibacteria bacterium RIFOXYA12_FULL_33_12]|nr:MAG: 6-carboxytetrahydropterin synthase QueD [Candidatus Peregrinibacteria bacterium RIFOXYA12_FULL_33_12]OGJ44395.1 MAG: 6-carboxytetrahydropterin synthase QueD [Candidatus Peregrinibacteria bacterium RIFOXYA2_FULL_33_21]OGJ50192.1 MAG: 6-carboxytetrahydropterin synthase QueD [Candidatus Peregrinibacteria bacterium RIFOXYB2_FULL_33_20]
MLVTKEFKFSAAHFLTQYHGQCEYLHGHNYRLQVTIQGPKFKNGMVVDFGILKKVVKEKVIDKLDHKNLNDFLKNPSAENIAVWIWGKLKDFGNLLKQEQSDPNVPEDLKKIINNDSSTIKKEVNSEGIKLYEIKLWETDENCIIYRG